MTSRQLCRYFVQGTCRSGSECPFLHDKSKINSTVCQFYLAGKCSYGSKCRYDHVKPQRPAQSAPNAVRQTPPQRVQQPAAPAVDHPPAARSAQQQPISWAAAAGGVSEPEPVDGLLVRSPAAEGPRGEAAWTAAAAGGAAARASSVGCEAAEAKEAAQMASEEVECSICLERVLGKASFAERRFGLLSACSHAFCLACIRDWRAHGETASSLQHTRTCPICRTVSFFIVPSAAWPADEAAKALVLEAYTARLGAVHCRHFDRGDGQCPFGTSCFYAHVRRDGTKEEPGPLRRVNDVGGDVRVVEAVRLSSFLAAAGGMEAFTRRR